MAVRVVGIDRGTLAVLPQALVVQRQHRRQIVNVVNSKASIKAGRIADRLSRRRQSPFNVEGPLGSEKQHRGTRGTVHADVRKDV